jgi:hypothetical protein
MSTAAHFALAGAPMTLGAEQHSVELETAGTTMDPSAVTLVAHDLLNHMSMFAGASGVLRERWEVLRPDERESLLRRIEAKAFEAGEVLRLVARGEVVGALALLDERRCVVD